MTSLNLTSQEKGDRFEKISLEFLKKFFEELGYTILEARPQNSGIQNGFDLYFELLDEGKKIILCIECKNYEVALKYEEVMKKIIELEGANYIPSAFIVISPKVPVKNKTHSTFLTLKDKASFPIKILDSNTSIKEVFSLKKEIYEKIYGGVPEPIDKNQIMVNFKEMMNNLLNEKKKKKILVPSCSMEENHKQDTRTNLDKKLNALFIIGDKKDDEYRDCCHQHLCDYRVFLESLEGNDEELRQEIISWESSLRLKAETLSSSFRKNPKKNSSEFYTEFFKIAETDLEKFMKDKYELEELQKLLHGIIFQLASQCPLDWEGQNE
jgi:hypothetical protein